MDATTTTATLDETWRSISELCHTLGPDDWDRPTDCPGWSVKDHLSHLIGTERMLQGLPSPEHPSPEAPYVRNDIGRFNELDVDARRGLAGPEVLAEFDEITATRLATLRDADEAYFAAEAMTPTGPGTVLDFLSIRILDSWVHEQDIRRAVDRPGHLSGPAAEHTTDRLIRTLPIVVGKRASAPEGSTTVIRLTGPVERTVPVTVEGGRARIVEAAPADPLATVAMDSETFLVLATGRQTAAAWAEQITLGGDRELGQAVADQLNMMI